MLIFVSEKIGHYFWRRVYLSTSGFIAAALIPKWGYSYAETVKNIYQNIYHYTAQLSVVMVDECFFTDSSYWHRLHKTTLHLWHGQSSISRWMNWMQILSHDLTHWGCVTHICVSTLTIIGSDNGLELRISKNKTIKTRTLDILIYFLGKGSAANFLWAI